MEGWSLGWEGGVVSGGVGERSSIVGMGIEASI